MPCRFVETRVIDTLCLVESPCLQLRVQNAEVFKSPWMHSALNLTFVSKLSFQATLLRFFGLKFQTIIALFTKLSCTFTRKHASCMTLNDHSLLKDQGSEISTGEVGFPCLHEFVTML